MTLTAQAVGNEVDPILRAADLEDIDGWFDSNAGQLRGVAERGYAVTSEFGARYVERHAAAEGVRLAAVRSELNAAQFDEALRITGPVAFKTNMRQTGNPEAALQAMRTRSAGTVKRLALAGARETTLGTYDEHEVVIGYRRITAPNPCAFCAMLAGRGAVFRSEGSALTVVGRGGRPRGNRRVGQSYHDSCRCTIEAVYGGGATTTIPLLDGFIPESTIGPAPTSIVPPLPSVRPVTAQTAGLIQ